MATVSLYTFQDREGCEQTFTTFSAREAKEVAEKNNWLCFDNEYEYSDRNVAWDCTGNHILWAACELGYMVQVFKGGEEEPEHEYRAGNSPRCSQPYVPLEGRQVSLEQLRRFAEQTAVELAREYHVTPLENIHEDAEVLERLKEELGIASET